jgi:hypothetical protein
MTQSLLLNLLTLSAGTAGELHTIRRGRNFRIARENEAHESMEAHELETISDAAIWLGMNLF